MAELEKRTMTPWDYTTHANWCHKRLGADAICNCHVSWDAAKRANRERQWMARQKRSVTKSDGGVE